MLSCKTCFRMYPTWRQLSRHIRDKHDNQPVSCKYSQYGCVLSMSRSRKSQLLAHEAKCKYHPINGGPTRNRKIHPQVEREMPGTPVQDELPAMPPAELPTTPSPRSCVALFQTTPPLLSPLAKSPQPTSALDIQKREMQESDAPMTTISSMETNEEWKDLQPMDKEKEGKNVYDHLHLDPRFFFLGAPSNYREEHCAEELNNIRERSIRTGTRAVSFFPPTMDHIRKEETATLPDGTTYQLRSFWYRTSSTTRCTATQTEETTNSSSTVKRDAQTQCSVHLQLTD